jgi:tRNA(Ile)-lysidine synthetase-like protein
MEARREYEALYLEKITESHRNRPEAENEGQMVSLLPEKIENQKIYMGKYGEKSYKIRVFPYVTSEKIPTNRYTKWLDYDRIEKPLMIRSRQTGDYIALSGGGRKSVKAYMVDEKIPAGSRDSIPVIASGSHVVWIVGYRISEQAKVTADTKRVLEITIYGGENERNDS